MTLEEIKLSLMLGHRVCWKNIGYDVVCTDNQYHIVFGLNTIHENSIGLTWKDGKTLNGNEEDFFIYKGE